MTFSTTTKLTLIGPYHITKKLKPHTYDAQVFDSHN
jgi:hypothetical protein